MLGKTDDGGHEHEISYKKQAQTGTRGDAESATGAAPDAEAKAGAEAEAGAV